GGRRGAQARSRARPSLVRATRRAAPLCADRGDGRGRGGGGFPLPRLQPPRGADQPLPRGRGVPRTCPQGTARGPHEHERAGLQRLRAAAARGVSGSTPLPRPRAPRDAGDGSTPMIVEKTAEELRSREFYRRVLECMHADGVRFLVGGAYALECFTGVARRTKDIDLFVAPAERDAA